MAPLLRQLDKIPRWDEPADLEHLLSDDAVLKARKGPGPSRETDSHVTGMQGRPPNHACMHVHEWAAMVSMVDMCL